MQKLTSKIAALTEQNDQNGVDAVDANQVIGNRPQQRFHRPTPQTQRYNYMHEISTRARRMGGVTGFLPRGRANLNPNDPECDRCGLRHTTTARCFAQGLQYDDPAKNSTIFQKMLERKTTAVSATAAAYAITTTTTTTTTMKSWPDAGRLCHRADARASIISEPYRPTKRSSRYIYRVFLAVAWLISELV